MEGERNDRITRLVLNGCSLAKTLESNLQNWSHPPQILAQKCDEIIGYFTMALDHLNSQYSLPFEHQTELDMTAFDYPQGKGKEVVVVGELEAGKVPMMKNVDSSGGHEHVNLWGPVVAGGSSGHQRAPRRSSSRKNEQGENSRKVVRVPAPNIGNTEVPPEDNFTWRKYGQKEILGAKYPRSYYRCTHAKLCNCPAKKQVQRLDNDPFTFEIVYRGEHTCYKSLTAPSAPPPPPSHDQDMIQPLISPPPALNQWLYVDLHGTSCEGGHTLLQPHQSDHQHLFHVSNSGPADPSTVGSDHHFLSSNMMEFADVRFNSGSSSSNSMEFIFPPSHDHDHKSWDGKKDNMKD